MSFFKRPMFIVLILIPNIVSLLYFGVVASPVYVSTSSLTVFNPSQTSSSIVSLLSGGSSDGSVEEAYILRDYIASWSEFQKLQSSTDLASEYERGDFVSRYGGLATLFRRNDVSLWHFYQKWVSVDVDVKSGAVMLNVKGYSPAFAHRLASKVLADAVAHMDVMNDQQELDFVQDAKAHEIVAKQIAATDEEALDAYRAKIGVYDPSLLYTSQLALANSLTSEDTQLLAQFNTMSAAAPNSPSAKDLQAAIRTVSSRILQIDQKIPIIANESKPYEELLVTRNNDVSVLQQASQAVQDAELKSEQNRYYIDTISAPSQPATAELPHRLEWVFGIFMITFIAWGLLR
ncbi:MAG: hypothetical protein POH28_09370 [Acidocella sp.]|nr:hypothetical protein [Acidocella sp.]